MNKPPPKPQSRPAPATQPQSRTAPVPQQAPRDPQPKPAPAPQQAPLNPPPKPEGYSCTVVASEMWPEGDLPPEKQPKTGLTAVGDKSSGPTESHGLTEASDEWKTGDPLREGGPTLEGFVKAGYKAENYPPRGYQVVGDKDAEWRAGMARDRANPRSVLDAFGFKRK